MKRQFTAVAVAAAIFLLAGCAKDSHTQLLELRQSHTLAVQSLHTAYASGALSPADLLKVEPYEKASRAALDAADAADAAGNTTVLESELKALRAAIDAIAKLRAQAVPAKP